MTQNDRQVRKEIPRSKGQESNRLSEASRMPLETISHSQQYYIPSDQDKGLKTALRFGNRANFITSEDNFVDDVWRSPGKISEQEKKEIIKTGFQFQAQRKISLKKYYEGRGEYTLFQLRGYSIKYETIRRTQLYQQLKLKL